jgi:hypothetical protein
MINFVAALMVMHGVLELEIISHLSIYMELYILQQQEKCFHILYGNHMSKGRCNPPPLHLHGHHVASGSDRRLRIGIGHNLLILIRRCPLSADAAAGAPHRLTAAPKLFLWLESPPSPTTLTTDSLNRCHRHCPTTRWHPRRRVAPPARQRPRHHVTSPAPPPRSATFTVRAKL